MRQVDHTDVGAYALGVLAEDDRRAFENHLNHCPTCTQELDELSAMGSLLIGLDADEVSPSPDPALAVSLAEPQTDTVTELFRARATADHRRLRVHRLAGAAAAVLLLIVGITTGMLYFGRDDSGTPVAHPVPSWAQDLVLTGERFSATNPATDLTGVVGIESKRWGTHVALELRGIRGPLRCRLVVLSRDGGREAVTSWTVPKLGWGVPESPEPLYVHGGTSYDRTDITRFAIETNDGKNLLTVPVRI